MPTTAIPVPSYATAVPLTVSGAPPRRMSIPNLVVEPQLPSMIVVPSAHQAFAAFSTGAQVDAHPESLFPVSGRPVDDWTPLPLSGISNPRLQLGPPVASSASTAGTPLPLLAPRQDGAGTSRGGASGTGISGPAVALFGLLGLIAPRFIRRLRSYHERGIPIPVPRLLEHPG
jgi:hypothetical protein